MQQTQTRITQHDLTDLPTRVMVVGYKYKVDFGLSDKPRVHLVDKQRRCSCDMGAVCPAISASRIKSEVSMMVHGEKRSVTAPPSTPPLSSTPRAARYPHAPSPTASCGTVAAASPR